MTRDEAKFLLQACCHNEAATSSPEVVEALSMAANDPELGEWFRREQEFDDAFALQVEKQEAPAGLRDQLLELAPQTRPEKKSSRFSIIDFFTSRQILRTTGSLAAAFALVAFISVIFFEPREATADAEIPEFFQKVQAELLANSAPSHMSEKPEELLNFLKDQNAPTPAPLPASIDALKRTGASTLQGKSSKVGVLYLEDPSGQKYRLFIVEMSVSDSVAPTLPDMSLKQFEQVSALTWKRAGKVHALVTRAPITTLELLRK